MEALEDDEVPVEALVVEPDPDLRNDHVPRSAVAKDRDHDPGQTVAAAFILVRAGSSWLTQQHPPVGARRERR